MSTLKVTDIKAADGTSALTIADSTGNVGIGGNLQLTSVNQSIEFNASSSADVTRLKWNYAGALQSWIERRHLDGSMVFGNQGAERMRIDTSGNVELKTASANLILPSGGGIDFGTSTSGTGMVTPVTGGVLDDYEEGTFSPTVSASSGTITTVSANGFYRKIGSTVICFIDFTITTNGTGSGLGIISNLPFSTTASSESSGAMRIDGFNGATASFTLDKSTNSLTLTKYDNTYPFGNNARGTLIVPYIVS